METVTSIDADRDFSRLLQRARSGQETTITESGVPVAKIIPFRVDRDALERRKQEHLAWLRQQPMIAVARGTRDELYEDE